MPRLPNSGREVHARVVGVVRGVERGVCGGRFAPKLVKGGVEEDVAVGGVGDELVERGVAGADDGDGTGDDCGSVEVGQEATRSEGFELLENDGKGGCAV